MSMIGQVWEALHPSVFIALVVASMSSGCAEPEVGEASGSADMLEVEGMSVESDLDAQATRSERPVLRFGPKYNNPEDPNIWEECRGKHCLFDQMWRAATSGTCRETTTRGQGDGGALIEDVLTTFGETGDMTRYENLKDEWAWVYERDERGRLVRVMNGDDERANRVFTYDDRDRLTDVSSKVDADAEATSYDDEDRILVWGKLRYEYPSEGVQLVFDGDSLISRREYAFDDKLVREQSYRNGESEAFSDVYYDRSDAGDLEEIFSFSPEGERAPYMVVTYLADGRLASIVVYPGSQSYGYTMVFEYPVEHTIKLRFSAHRTSMYNVTATLTGEACERTSEAWIGYAEWFAFINCDGGVACVI